MEAKKLDTNTILKKMDEIPSLPAIVYELSRIINDPMSSTKEVEIVMGQDIGMTTKVLKLANSAYYAIPGGVSSLARAIAFIGFDTIHQLVLSASIIKALDTKGPSVFDINQFWKHSIGTAIASEVIAKYMSHPSPPEVFTCGLTHDIGKLILFLASPDTMTEVLKSCEEKQSTYLDVETSLGLPPHHELGKILCERWLLPKAISLTARYHHEFDAARRGGMAQEMNQTVDIVALANLLIHALKFGNAGHSKVLGAPTELLNRMSISTQGDLPGIIKSIKTELEKASDFIRNIGS